jgi:hypothetical protein
MRLLIGIDDTDNRESRGTGFQARSMAAMLAREGLARVNGITRHQHFVHPDIPYTSQNSSACIVAETDDIDLLWSACSDFLLNAAAEGSDAGLAITLPEQIQDELITWAASTKQRVVSMEEAVALANKTGIRLKGFTGNHQGIIGALAATALRHHGNDGRFIATGNNFHLRELPAGSYTALSLLEATQADLVTDLHFRPVAPSDMVLVGDYLRPVLRNQKCTILVTKTDTANDWESAGKDILRNY